MSAFTHRNIKNSISKFFGGLGSFMLKQLKLMPGRLKRVSIAFARYCYRHAAGLSIILVAVLSTGFLLLVPLKIFYRDRFFLNTWINSVYSAGFNVEKANETLKKEFPNETLKIIFEDRTEEIRLADYVSEYDYEKPLSEIFEKQAETPFYRSFISKKYHISPEMEIRPELDEYWDEITYDPSVHDFSYRFSTWHGYFVKDDTLGHVFDRDKAYDAFIAAFRNCDDTVDLSEEEFFYDLKPDARQKKLIDAFEKLDRFQRAGISYDMGDEILTISPSQMCSMLVLNDGYPMVNEKGCYVIDESKIPHLVETLFEPYNTIAKNREFRTVTDKIVMTNSGDYGTEIDMKTEENYLTYALMRAVLGDTDFPYRVPDYNITAHNRGLNDIGLNYIEVDIANQKIYIVSDGKCTYEADIVTGRDRHSTPSGLFTVTDSQKDRFLVQYNYSVYVQYVISLSNGLYITDAMWRDEFGTDSYHENGSYGNIEMAEKDAETVYEAVIEGMPVIVYSEEDIAGDYISDGET